MTALWWLSFRGVGAMIVPAAMAKTWDQAINVAETHGAPPIVEVVGGFLDMEDPRNTSMTDAERRFNADVANHLRMLSPAELRAAVTLVDGATVDAAIDAADGNDGVGVDFKRDGGFELVEKWTNKQ